MYMVKTEYGDHMVSIEKKRYVSNNRLAIQLNEEYEPFAMLTTNIDDGRDLPDGYSYVDTNNCPWAEDFIRENHLGEPTGDYESSGFCTYPLYRFEIGD